MSSSQDAGNAAAIREALKMFVDAYSTTSYTLCIENLRPAYQKAIAALAAPARNCDLPYNDSVEMYGTFKDWCKAKGHTMEPMLACDAFEWLLSPATEQKGDSGGSK